MKILLAYDGSRCAEAALDEVLQRPWPAGTEVRVVTAVERPAYAPAVGGIEGLATFGERLGAELREEAYRQIQRALERFATRAELKTSYELRDGDAKSALLAAIREWKPDLVVAGSHGKTPLERFLLGSVSHALVSHAPCNVEIVKASTAA
jgi:nucleotide-binding universal stress UspA family protein